MRLLPLTVLSAGALIIIQPSCRREAKPLSRQVAEAYGFRHFSRVKSIAYTFNVKAGSLEIARSWKWLPGTGEIYFMNSTDSLHYRRDTITTERMKQVDRKFLNDRRWLLFPFRLVWDNKDTFSVRYGQVMPVSRDTATCLTVYRKSPGNGQPAYTYDLYLDKDRHIREWAYRRGGDPIPAFITTWENMQTFKGIKIATMHRDKEGAFKLWFSRIRVE